MVNIKKKELDLYGHLCFKSRAAKISQLNVCCLTANSRPVCAFRSMEADLTSNEKFPGDISSVWLPGHSLPPDATKYTHIYCLKPSH